MKHVLLDPWFWIGVFVVGGTFGSLFPDVVLQMPDAFFYAGLIMMVWFAIVLTRFLWQHLQKR